MTRVLKTVMFVTLIVAGLAVLFRKHFTVLMLLITFAIFDQASYRGNQLYVGPIDYDRLLKKAGKAGYDVSGPWTRLDGVDAIQPGNVESLEKRFNNGYRVHRIELYYNNTQGVELCAYDSPNVHITLLGSGCPDSAWMLHMFRLAFGWDERRSDEYLGTLQNGSQSTDFNRPEMIANEMVDFPAVYAYLKQSSTRVVFNPGMWNEERFFSGAKRIGYVAYLIPETTISTSHYFNKYSVDVSSSGYLRASIVMHRASTGGRIDKEEYIGVFKEVFENLGLPVETVDKFEFEYSPSVW